MSEDRKTVVIADDHPLLLRGLADMVAASLHFRVVATAADGRSAFQEIKSRSPNLAVLDVHMPGLSGVDILKEILAHRLPTRVILLTASISDAEIFEAIELGVHSVVLKDSAPDTLLDCMKVVAAGRRWLSPDLIEPALARETDRRGEGRKLIAELTEREIEVISLVAEGHPNKVIARRLGLTEGTVKVHLHNIYQKLGVDNRTALATLAMAHGDLMQRKT